jgi:hypothetical protein
MLRVRSLGSVACAAVVAHASGACACVSISLAQAWSQIVYSLMPNVQELESHLVNFCEIIGADEVVVFEKGTACLLAVCARIRLFSPFFVACVSPQPPFS